MDVDALLAAMTPEVYQRLMTAVELGKWPDGTVLSSEQKESSLQMVMLWQARNNHHPEHMSIGTDGAIVMKSKHELLAELTGQAPVIFRGKAE